MDAKPCPFCGGSDLSIIIDEVWPGSPSASICNNCGARGPLNRDTSKAKALWDLRQQQIFVFGSNLAGRHGAGAALHATLHYGAARGIGRGRTGSAYAIPTKDKDLQTLPLDRIKYHVAVFLAYAKRESHLYFKVTAIGTGLAGYTHKQIAPMFKGAPSNCLLPDEWEEYL